MYILDKENAPGVDQRWFRFWVFRYYNDVDNHCEKPREGDRPGTNNSVVYCQNVVEHTTVKTTGPTDPQM